MFLQYRNNVYLCRNKPFMCSRQQCISLHTDAAPFIRNEFGVRSLRLFGSMARGDNHSDSDVDLCVDMPPKAFKLLSLKVYLQDLLGMAVDLVRMTPHLDNFLLTEIERDGICIFSQSAE